jgi:hypothetical protein
MPQKARYLSGAGADSSEDGPRAYEVGSSEASDPMEEAGDFALWTD